MIKFIKKIQALALEILFPLKCLGCKIPNTLLCAKCFNKIPLNQTLFCADCNRRLAQNKKICHLKTAFVLAAAGSYENDILRELILTFKYKKLKPVAGILAEILNRYIKNLNLDFKKYEIIPIPLHQIRQKERGFNQAELIANTLIAVNSNLRKSHFLRLKRIKNNRPQAQIKNHNQRQENIRDCFQVVNPEKIKGKNIILLDDVSTSGATLEEAAKMLKKSGAKKIIGLVIAKK
ncbi:MAG: ComF family protein [Candidatus Brennerbacteria bacterium]|nr:ComF family protein [Candidatus Brennerbacteria bacterium]